MVSLVQKKKRIERSLTVDSVIQVGGRKCGFYESAKKGRIGGQNSGGDK